MMLQDIYPSKLNNQYDPTITPELDDYVLIIKDNEICIKTGEKNTFPQVKDIPSSDGEYGLIYLFSLDSVDSIGEERFFLTTKFSADIETEGVFEFYNLKQIREEAILEKKYIFAAYTGKHLDTWYRNNQYCGKCGSVLTHSETERAMCCPNCGNTIYPKIMPAVIVGVKNGDRLLITRYKRGYNHNALIAGFTEIGETLEETVEREVMEEAGIHVKNIKYYKSQPWGIASDILAGFYCEVDGDDTIRMDEGELKFAEWLYRDEIELQPDESSLTNEMMKRFKEGRE